MLLRTPPLRAYPVSWNAAGGYSYLITRSCGCREADFKGMEDKEIEASMGRRLTDIERERWREQLQVRMPLNTMLDLVDELHKVTGSTMLMQAGLEFARNAWIAARFAKLRGADEVRLWPEARPDFEMKLSGTYELFEAIEADEPDRRRGDEYRLLHSRTGESGIEYDPEEDVIARADKAQAMLERAASRKASGNYDPSCGLVILLNLSEFGWRQREVEACMASATAPAKDCFREVWVLWKGLAYRTMSGFLRPNAKNVFDSEFVFVFAAMARLRKLLNTGNPIEHLNASSLSMMGSNGEYVAFARYGDFYGRYRISFRTIGWGTLDDFTAARELGEFCHALPYHDLCEEIQVGRIDANVMRHVEEVKAEIADLRVRGFRMLLGVGEHDQWS
jgi:hypothetical protein